MNIYAKLAEARAKFHALDIKKSGHNKFAGYKYFELADFLIPGMKVLTDSGLLPVISFDASQATLTVYETEGDGTITITSPMADANLKAAHPIQNLGAVETYQRRYLWMALLEIVEHDAVDSGPPVEKQVTDIESIRSKLKAAPKDLAEKAQKWIDKEGGLEKMKQSTLEALSERLDAA